MKTITINVPEPVYREFQAYARSQDRKASELIREALVAYRDEKIRARHSIRGIKPLSLGQVYRPLTGREDFLEEMRYSKGN